MRDKNSLNQMAKNLTKCSKRSLEDVLLFLSEEDKAYLILKMQEFKSKNI